MTTIAILPIKRLAAAKHRLRDELDPTPRRALVEAMFADDEDEGHNMAARRGIARARELDADRALLVPGDCPLLDPAEVDALLEEDAPAPSVLIVPDRHGTGTNALVLTPPGALAPSFGPGSHKRHRDEATAAGVTKHTVEVPTLALDIDTPEDLVAVGA